MNRGNFQFFKKSVKKALTNEKGYDIIVKPSREAGKKRKKVLTDKTECDMITITLLKKVKKKA
jgi:hypothetical protein